MRLIYKPFGLLLGILAGLLGKRVFDFAWTKIDDEDPPKATTRERHGRRCSPRRPCRASSSRSPPVVDRYGARRGRPRLWREGDRGRWPGGHVPLRVCPGETRAVGVGRLVFGTLASQNIASISAAYFTAIGAPLELQRRGQLVAAGLLVRQDREALDLLGAREAALRLDRGAAIAA